MNLDLSIYHKYTKMYTVYMVQENLNFNIFRARFCFENDHSNSQNFKTTFLINLNFSNNFQTMKQAC